MIVSITQSKAVSLVGYLAIAKIMIAVPALSQSSGYFSEWEDGNVIREIGRDIVDAGCKVDHETALSIVTQNMKEFDPDNGSTAEEYWGIILGNLTARQQVELDHEEKLYVITQTGECG